MWRVAPEHSRLIMAPLSATNAQQGLSRRRAEKLSATRVMWVGFPPVQASSPAYCAPLDTSNQTREWLHATRVRRGPCSRSQDPLSVNRAVQVTSPPEVDPPRASHVILGLSNPTQG